LRIPSPPLVEGKFPRFVQLPDHQDLVQNRLSNVTDPLRDERVVAEEGTALEVKGGRVVERGGEMEDVGKEFNRKTVAHCASREVRGMDSGG
jgi:hypothetical protein